MGEAAGARTAELAAGVARVRGRIAAACAAAGRDPDEVTLVAVTKTYPVDDVLRLIDLGVHDIGENRDQEAVPKAPLAGPPDPPSARLADLAGRVRAVKPGATLVSAGMSEDLEAAIAH